MTTIPWLVGPVTLEELVAERLRALERDDVIGRIWRYDHTVWKPDPIEIADRLGWLTVGEAMRGRLEELEAFAARVAEDGLTHVVLCGMGGSSLAPEVLARTFGVSRLPLTVLDTTHPAAIAGVERELDLPRTLFVIASKSGSTVETMSQFRRFHSMVGTGDNFVAITDPGSPLETLALDAGFRSVFVNPPDIGGRYSALSLFGLVPAALLGVDLTALLDGADRMARACRMEPNQNPGAWLGVVIAEAASAGRDKLTFLLPEGLASFGDWAEQLIAESTGKEGTGIVPVVGEPTGDAASFGEDRLFVVLGDRDGPEGQPVVRITDASPAGLGAEFFRFEFATAVAGALLGIQPFDQPDVAEAKDATNRALDGALEPAGFDDPSEVFDAVRPGDYIAIQAFLEPTPDNHAVLQLARTVLRDRFGVATTVGFGPRYLHSTGQLHKGGPDTGVFLQVVDRERAVDLEIPGAPYTFGRLIDAQAEGDLRSLRARGRRVARVRLEDLR